MTPELQDSFDKFCKQILSCVDEQPKDEMWLAKLHYLRGAIGARIWVAEQEALSA